MGGEDEFWQLFLDNFCFGSPLLDWSETPQSGEHVTAPPQQGKAMVRELVQGTNKCNPCAAKKHFYDSTSCEEADTPAPCYTPTDQECLKNQTY